MRQSFVFFLSFLLISMEYCISAYSQDVLTQHNNLERTGWNDRETILNKSNVKAGSFGKLFTRVVDDQLFAQPLVKTNVNIPSAGLRNIVYLASVNNSVYAYDADSASQTDPYWKINLTPVNSRPIRQVDLFGACPGNFLSNIGIVGTPVIDSSTLTIYLVARSVDTVSHIISQYLHALDITTGAERPNSPVLIEAQVPGTGDGNDSGIVHFDPLRNNQRPALLLLRGNVYIGFSSHCDWGPYHGWLLGYDKTSLQQKVVYNDTPDGYNGGIWMSGTGMAADSSGNIYFSTGNGSVGVDSTPANLRNRSESVIRFDPSTGTVKDFFTPNNFPTLEYWDWDLGTSGVMIIPGASRTVTGCKDGTLYLLNQDSLGAYNASKNQCVQSYSLGPNASMHSQFSYYRGASREFAYFWPENTPLTAIPFNRLTGKFDTLNILTSSLQGPVGQTGSMLSVSSNGSLDSTGILWASYPVWCDGENYNCPGTLRAFDASDITKELWNSDINYQDNPGNFAKFSSPTIANGKVYLGTFSNQLVVYGLQTSTNDSCNTTNIARGKPAYASSVEAVQYLASAAFDGNLNTRWSSQFSDPQSIYADLGTEYSICRVVLRWETAFGQNFLIQTSANANDTGWTTIANVSDNNSQVTFLDVAGQGRYIRMYGTTRATPYGYSLYEFQVYGTPVISSIVPQAYINQQDVPFIFPNPAGDFLNITQGADRIISVSIYGLAGNKILESRNENSGKIFSLSITGLPASVYLVKIRTRNNIFKQKLVKA